MSRPVTSMKGAPLLLTFVCAVLVILLIFPLGYGDDDQVQTEGQARDPCEGTFTCLPDGTINCMPVVPPERGLLCGGECHEWIVENCPNVEFSW
jgi:hypothetical protein